MEATAASESPTMGASWAPAYAHGAFLLMIALGGALSALQTGQFSLRWSLGADFAELMGTGGVAAAVLVGGGFLVGFGTRMGSGCTTGHGLCGVSRFQPGSLVATGAFFGTGVVTSYALEWLL